MIDDNESYGAREYLHPLIMTVHLRDGCPHVQFSGRSTGLPPVIAADGSIVELRVPCSEIPGHLWQVLCLDSDIRRAITDARTGILDQLNEMIGRAARVKDLALLGKNTCALVPPGAIVDGETALE